VVKAYRHQNPKRQQATANPQGKTRLQTRTAYRMAERYTWNQRHNQRAEEGRSEGNAQYVVSREEHTNHPVECPAISTCYRRRPPAETTAPTRMQKGRNAQVLHDRQAGHQPTFPPEQGDSLYLASQGMWWWGLMQVRSSSNKAVYTSTQTCSGTHRRSQYEGSIQRQKWMAQL
jgi:hypothetical protein